MTDTFYLHLDFVGKNGWSVNLPFMCSKCGVCCTLDDFLTAGEVKATPKDNPEVCAKMGVLFDALGKMWEADPAKYDKYITYTPCPFLVDNSCSIYVFRPEGCRLFPKTAFGMLTKDCESLNRFKKQRAALKKGKSCKEKYFFTKTAQGKDDEPIKPAKFTQKQFQSCIGKLQKAGVTADELALFKRLNGLAEYNSYR